MTKFTIKGVIQIEVSYDIECEDAEKAVATVYECYENSLDGEGWDTTTQALAITEVIEHKESDEE